MSTRKTKIVCTLGPSTDSKTELLELIEAGMDIARLNFSHGDYKQYEEILKNLRKAEKENGKKIENLADLQGPKIRVGGIVPEGISVKRGEKITLTVDTKNKTAIPVQYKKIVRDLKAGQRLLIDDGNIELTVEKISGKNILCKVKNNGVIKNHKGINLPDSKVSAPTITPKDKKDLAFALKHDFQWVALSFVKNAADIKKLRKLAAPKQIRVIAKIERPEAVQNLEEIIKECEGVMVARGDLGIEIPPEQVPIVQKRMIRLANKHNTFVITATQVLASMVENPRPTRAEISDAANAVFDHSDAIMLSNETSVGKYPAKAARTLKRVISAVEKEMKKHPELTTYDL